MAKLRASKRNLHEEIEERTKKAPTFRAKRKSKIKKPWDQTRLRKTVCSHVPPYPQAGQLATNKIHRWMKQDKG